jgi:hypothetical protein
MCIHLFGIPCFFYIFVFSIFFYVATLGETGWGGQTDFGYHTYGQQSTLIQTSTISSVIKQVFITLCGCNAMEILGNTVIITRVRFRYNARG